MRKIYKLAVVVTALAAVVAANAQDPNKNSNPGSLWSAKAKDPLRDRTASKEGDVITILINEVSSSTYSASTNAKKDDSTNIAKGLGPILGNLIPALGIGASSNTGGSGSTTQSGRFTARLSAVVRKVLPNGLLVIEGTRTIQTNKETQIFKLTGLVRKEDVRPDNTVLSEHIADAAIIAEGKGMIQDRQKRGILTRLLDWLF